MIDMHSKTVLVTGANSGIGFVTACRLAEAGAEIVMVCRDTRRGGEARTRIAERATGPPPQLFIADLSSQEEIRDLARDIHFAYDHIDVLLNNAGGVFAKRELSADGIEKTFATNHLAPFLLTNLLLDLVQAAPAGRVVTVATEVYAKKLDFANLQGERSYQFFTAYQRSKLSNILFSFELARRLEGTTATSNAVSPGPSKTGFGNNISGPVGLLLRLAKRLPIFGSAEKGARTLIYAATDPELARVTGRFFFKSKELDTKPITRDSAIAARLWRVSDELCGGDTTRRLNALPSEGAGGDDQPVRRRQLSRGARARFPARPRRGEQLMDRRVVEEPRVHRPADDSARGHARRASGSRGFRCAPRLAARHRRRLPDGARHDRAHESLVGLRLAFVCPAVNLAVTLIGTLVLALLAPVRRAVRFKPGEALRYA